MQVLENREQIAALLKALDQVAYALHGFCVKGMEIFGEPPMPPTTETLEPSAPPIVPAVPEVPAESESIDKEATTPAPLTEEAVRKVLTAKTKAGFSARIKELLPKHGATKLSDIPKENYAALLAEVEALS